MRQGPAPVNVRSRRLRLRHVLIANSSSSGLVFPRDITALAEGCDTIPPFCAVDQCAPVKPEKRLDSLRVLAGSHFRRAGTEKRVFVIFITFSRRRPRYSSISCIDED